MKRSAAIILVVGCSLAVAACPPRTVVFPRPPDQVRLFDPDLNEFPEPGYDHIGPVNAITTQGTDREELLRELRAVAGRRGAEAVILQRVYTTTQPPDGREREEPVQVAEGLAIFWP